MKINNQVIDYVHQDLGFNRLEGALIQTTGNVDFILEFIIGLLRFFVTASSIHSIMNIYNFISRDFKET